jgi:hypothetical protein
MARVGELPEGLDEPALSDEDPTQERRHAISCSTFDPELLPKRGQGHGIAYVNPQSQIEAHQGSQTCELAKRPSHPHCRHCSLQLAFLIILASHSIRIRQIHTTLWSPERHKYPPEPLLAVRKAIEAFVPVLPVQLQYSNSVLATGSTLPVESSGAQRRPGSSSSRLSAQAGYRNCTFYQSWCNMRNSALGGRCQSTESYDAGN